ncbi:hypothetical protein VNO80_19794 [Phaseolus coccineus]|uniref:Uncharacterized protein n=1 Tax=Phaseolus coccineus TaxID=3886 RepID=A0AAN9R121_PHACN
MKATTIMLPYVAGIACVFAAVLGGGTSGPLFAAAIDDSGLDFLLTLYIAVVKKKGRNNVTVDELVHVITPKVRETETIIAWDVFSFSQTDNIENLSNMFFAASVPDTIKAELLQRIRSLLVSAAL